MRRATACLLGRVWMREATSLKLAEPWEDSKQTASKRQAGVILRGERLSQPDWRAAWVMKSSSQPRELRRSQKVKE